VIRIDRKPNELIELFDAVARRLSLSLGDSGSHAAFLAELSKSLSAKQSSGIALHGKRVESMFEYVAASLGKTILIKREDSGQICSSATNIAPPDFRIVLEDRREIFVEVKNCHKTDPKFRFKIKSAYLESLKNYAAIFGRELLIAIYWSRWKKWTAIRPEDLPKLNDKVGITFPEAVQANRMVMLGDTLIATTEPLSMKFITDSAKPRSIDESGHVTFTIGSVEFYCNSRLIEDDFEKQLAFYFMLYSNWESGDSVPEIQKGELISLTFVAKPQQSTPGQDFEMLGYLSDMISRRYDELTAKGSEVVRLRPTADDPSTLGVIIPPDYRGKHLPLWRFSVSPRQADAPSMGNSELTAT